MERTNNRVPGFSFPCRAYLKLKPDKQVDGKAGLVGDADKGYVAKRTGPLRRILGPSLGCCQPQMLEKDVDHTWEQSSVLRHVFRFVSRVLN